MFYDNIDINISIPTIRGPPKLGYPSYAHTTKILNPSIILSPDKLCTKCTYIVSARIDPLHQCDDNSPLFTYRKKTQANAWFKSTAIILYDEHFNVLKWTWILNDPQYQIKSRPSRSRWDVPVGVSNDYNPPWSKGIYDARLFLFRNNVYVTYNCKGCDFSVSQLHLDIKEENGEIKDFRCWSLVRHKYNKISSIQGRNQALFAANNKMYIQYWINKVGTFGEIKYNTVEDDCTVRRIKNIGICGIHPIGTKNVKENILKKGTYRHVYSDVSLTKYLQTLYNFTGRISTTCHLIKTKNGFLGIGHFHRKNGKRNSKKRYAFGYEYKHFWYMLENVYPHNMKSISKSFCINNCDSIQFLSGLVLKNENVFVSYGINDCVSKIVKTNIHNIYDSMITI